MHRIDREIATIAGGCFWCLEAVFEQVAGIASVESGFSGGHLVQPSYEQVCSETTGHAESVQLTFNPHIVSYRQILDIFFEIHDPTTLNFQGHDVGSRYRSAIFYHTGTQEDIAQEVVRELGEARIWDNPIVTEILPMAGFYRAEDYHQQFYQRNREQPYCQIVIAPKLAKFREKYVLDM